MERKGSLAATARGRDQWIGPMLILSLILLAVGLALPALSVGNFLFRKDYSILQGVWAFWKAGKYFLFVVVGAFSVLLPAAKTLLCAFVWFAVPRAHPRAAKLVRLLAAISKWSMLDVFIIAITVLVLEGSLLSSADVHVGVIAFAAAVLLSTVAVKRMAALVAGYAEHPDTE
jgi:paraquat-inducible protein A